ncbi:uncharacterized protein [Hetaerina americana]|uniref:uncharacterized protein n=1 Tax=Hetaerina americana TaxID=62018 RepID=UPI003A7F2D76
MDQQQHSGRTGGDDAGDDGAPPSRPPPLVDILGHLPAEVATDILRKLDDESLFNAARVSKKWFSLVKSHNELQRQIWCFLNTRKGKHKRITLITYDLWDLND